MDCIDWNDWHAKYNEILTWHWRRKMLSAEKRWRYFVSIEKVVHHWTHTRWFTMKLFQFMQKIYQNLGVVSSSQHSPQQPINSKILIILLPMTFFCVSSVIVFFESETTQESADAVFWATAAYASILTFLHTVRKMPMVFDMVGQFEGIIRKSKTMFSLPLACEMIFMNLSLRSSPLPEYADPIMLARYAKMNARIEGLSELYHLLFIRYFIVLGFLPWACITYVFYKFDWGDDSYTLPFPTA